MARNLILLFSIFSLLVGCNNGIDNIVKNSDKELLTQLINKYPELSKDTIGNYHVIRTVLIGEKKVGLKLFSNKHDYNTPNSIIIINNSKGENYAIPLFSNNLRKYWNFENEVKTFKNNYYKSLFEKEFILAINLLNLNDTLGTGRIVLFEIFHSLLHFQHVTEYDKEYLHDLRRHLVNSDLHNDEEIESERRNDLNCKQVLKDNTKTEFGHHYNSLLDLNNYRVFQIEFPKRSNEKILKLNIKIYRFGQEVIPLEM